MMRPLRMKLIAYAKSLGHQRTRLHNRSRRADLYSEARSEGHLRVATQLSRSGRRKTARSHRAVQHAAPTACRIVQKRNHRASGQATLRASLRLAPDGAALAQPPAEWG